MTPESTAAQRYDERQNNILALIDEIRGDIAIHNVHFDRHGRRSWSAVGDLGYIEEQLQEISNFLNNKE